MVGGFILASIIIILLYKQIIPFNNIHNKTIFNGTAIATSISMLNENSSLNIEEVSKAVVGISSRQQHDIWNSSIEAGTGSGIIYKKENGKAYIITNHHVVAKAKEIEVHVDDGKKTGATVLGTDSLSDLALLEIDDSEVQAVAKFGNSNDLQVGQTVFAIGNPISLDFSGTVTKGIISGLNRHLKVDTTGNQQPDWISEVIQTDAAINPGNSGGALVNAIGEVIGINSMKIARQSVEGIGFSIPIDTALPIIKQLKKHGKVTRPFIGINMVELHQVPYEYQNKISLPEGIAEGIVIAHVESNSPAEIAGLQQFDVITKINDEPITSILDLRKHMYTETSIGETIVIERYRNGRKTNIKLKLVEQKRRE